MFKRLLVIGCLCSTTFMWAQHVTITLLSGEAWSEAVEKIGYMQIRQDSIFLINKDGIEIGKSALADIHKMAITDSPTALPEVIQQDALHLSGVHVYTIQGMPVSSDWETLPAGVYLWQQGTQIYKIEKQ